MPPMSHRDASEEFRQRHPETFARYLARRKMVFFVAYAGYVCAYLVRNNFKLTSEALRLANGWSLTQVGLILTAFTVTYGFGKFIMGMLVYGPQLIVNVLTLNLVPLRAAGVAVGFVGLGGYLVGELCANLVMPLLAERFNWTASLSFLAGIAGAAGLLYLSLRAHEAKTVQVAAGEPPSGTPPRGPPAGPRRRCGLPAGAMRNAAPHHASPVWPAAPGLVRRFALGLAFPVPARPGTDHARTQTAL